MIRKFHVRIARHPKIDAVLVGVTRRHIVRETEGSGTVCVSVTTPFVVSYISIEVYSPYKGSHFNSGYSTYSISMSLHPYLSTSTVCIYKFKYTNGTDSYIIRSTVCLGWGRRGYGDKTGYG